MSREAMKLALDALEISPMSRKNKDAIDTLREALATPDFWDGYVPEPVKQQALDKMAENARELGLDYEMPITMQEGEFDCTHAERLCAELKAAHPVTPCTHPSLGACSLREDGTASRWNCVMCGTEFVPRMSEKSLADLYQVGFNNGRELVRADEREKWMERTAILIRGEREACHALRQTLPNPYGHCQVGAHAYDMAIAAYGAAIRARSNT